MSLSSTLRALSLPAEKGNSSSHSGQEQEDFQLQRKYFDDNDLSKSAEKAQMEFGEFDAEDIYHTSVNPFSHTRQERDEYGKQAVTFFDSGDVPKI